MIRFKYPDLQKAKPGTWDRSWLMFELIRNYKLTECFSLLNQTQQNYEKNVFFTLCIKCAQRI